MHEIDHLSNISMNRTVKQLGKNSGEKKRTVSIGLIFCEVKCVAFRDMQQMSHDHSMFFVTFYTDSCSERGLGMLVDYSGQKKINVEFSIRMIVVSSVG